MGEVRGGGRGDTSLPPSGSLGKRRRASHDEHEGQERTRESFEFLESVKLENSFETVGKEWVERRSLDNLQGKVW